VRILRRVGLIRRKPGINPTLKYSTMAVYCTKQRGTSDIVLSPKQELIGSLPGSRCKAMSYKQLLYFFLPVALLIEWPLTNRAESGSGSVGESSVLPVFYQNLCFWLSAGRGSYPCRSPKMDRVLIFWWTLPRW
jgi:hypothetical protein